MQSPIEAPKAPSSFKIYSQRYQALIDTTTPYTAYRWTATALIFVIYFIRVFLVQGWYIVTVNFIIIIPSMPLVYIF